MLPGGADPLVAGAAAGEGLGHRLGLGAGGDPGSHLPPAGHVPEVSYLNSLKPVSSPVKSCPTQLLSNRHQMQSHIHQMHVHVQNDTRTDSSRILARDGDPAEYPSRRRQACAGGEAEGCRLEDMASGWPGGMSGLILMLPGHVGRTRRGPESPPRNRLPGSAPTDQVPRPNELGGRGDQVQLLLTPERCGPAVRLSTAPSRQDDHTLSGECSRPGSSEGGFP